MLNVLNAQLQFEIDDLILTLACSRVAASVDTVKCEMFGRLVQASGQVVRIDLVQEGCIPLAGPIRTHLAG